jgi:hypothetical protein
MNEELINELMRKLEHCQRERDMLHAALNQMVAEKLAEETGISKDMENMV